MKLTVQRGATSLAVEIHDTEQDCTCIFQSVSDQTGIPVQKQKLIHKGKLVEPGTNLNALKLQDGAKLLLLASGSTSTSGQVAAKTAEGARAERRQRIAVQPDATKAKETQAKDDWQRRMAKWRKLEMIMLSDEGLESLPPPEVCNLTAAQSIDLKGNRLTELPSAFSQLTNLRSLGLSRNSLMDATHVVNKLHTVLIANHNELTSLPTSFGGCSALRHLELAHNRITEVPKELGQLKRLSKMDLEGNRIQEIHARVLRECEALSTLKLQDNPLTIERFREADGFKEFDERRRNKYNRQIEMRVMRPEEGFEEGADFVEYRHH